MQPLHLPLPQSPEELRTNEGHCLGLLPLCSCFLCSAKFDQTCIHAGVLAGYKSKSLCYCSAGTHRLARRLARHWQGDGCWKYTCAVMSYSLA
jgi:hypothetical protein